MLVQRWACNVGRAKRCALATRMPISCAHRVRWSFARFQGRHLSVGCPKSCGTLCKLWCLTTTEWKRFCKIICAACQRQSDMLHATAAVRTSFPLVRVLLPGCGIEIGTLRKAMPIFVAQTTHIDTFHLILKTSSRSVRIRACSLDAVWQACGRCHSGVEDVASAVFAVRRATVAEYHRRLRTTQGRRPNSARRTVPRRAIRSPNRPSVMYGSRICRCAKVSMSLEGRKSPPVIAARNVKLSPRQISPSLLDVRMLIAPFSSR